MDSRAAAAEMYIVSGGDAGSERDDVRACILLDLHWGLG